MITLLETWGGMQTIPSYLADTRAVSTLQLPAAHNLADLTNNRATGYGVTAEIATTPDYPLTQLWAAALHAAGVTGIRYWARHDLQHPTPASPCSAPQACDRHHPDPTPTASPTTPTSSANCATPPASPCCPSHPPRPDPCRPPQLSRRHAITAIAPAPHYLQPTTSS